MCANFISKTIVDLFHPVLVSFDQNHNMKKNRCKLIILLGWMTFLMNVQSGISQCGFQCISNDTAHQDYIDIVFEEDSTKNIISFGTRFTRYKSNDSIYNALVFQKLSDCGEMLQYKTITSFRNFILRPERLPYHPSYYPEEFIGNHCLRTSQNRFVSAIKVQDSLSRLRYVMLVEINKEGEFSKHGVCPISAQKANQFLLSHLIQLTNKQFVAILWDLATGYEFLYFDEELEFQYAKSFTMDRGIRAIIALQNGDFICSAAASDKYGFQFYRIDSLAQILWMQTPAEVFGSIRDLMIRNDSIYLVGNYGNTAALLIADLNGNILKSYYYTQQPYCNQRFSSLLLNDDRSASIGAYVRHCDPEDPRGADLSVFVIDPKGSITNQETFNFISRLGNGNSSQKNYFTDFGCNGLSKTSEQGLLMYGTSMYSDVNSNAVLHHDALLVKTKPLHVVQTKNKLDEQSIDIKLKTNPVHNELELIGPIQDIQNWWITDLYGNIVASGSEWVNPLQLNTIRCGLFFLHVGFDLAYSNSLKFVCIK